MNDSIDFKHHVSWSVVGYAIDNLVKAVKDSNIEFTKVVGIERGGTIPAAAIARRLGLPLQLIQYSSKSGNGDDKGALNNIPEFSSIDTILVVDDIADTGNTLLELKTELNSNTRFAVLYEKATSMFKPDFRYVRISISSCFYWVVFPWEE